MPGVIKNFQDGSFLGIIGEREEQALNALEQLRSSATWDVDLSLPYQDFLYKQMLSQPRLHIWLSKGHNKIEVS
jgi:hypothetical protein